MEVTDILKMKTYDLSEEEKTPYIENCLGREDWQLIKTYTSAVKESCRTAKGLFSIQSQKLKAWHNWIVLSFQY